VIPVRLTLPRRTALIVVYWIVAGACLLPWDVCLARQMIADLMPEELRGLLHRAEVFGHAYGVLGMLITIYLLDPGRRRKLIHVAMCYLTAGLVADSIKLQVWRMRPRPYVELGREAGTFLGTIWTGPRVDWTTLFDHTRHSFPSAHTAGAVALAYSLGRIYPQGQTWFYVLAALCGLNRVDGGAHFASDVCWGAALGYLIASLLPTAEQIEARLAPRASKGLELELEPRGTRPLSKAA
jgi:membrane-associated phospholipid phosphatase